MKTTLYRSPEDGKLHETGPIDWENETAQVVCSNVGNGTTDDLEATRKDPTCPDCRRIGPKFEWSDDWNASCVDPGPDQEVQR